MEPRAIDVLVLAAHAVELEGLPRLLRGPPVIASAVVGVGLTAAGAGTARALCEHRPRAVVLVGSFGRYPGVGDACATGAVCVAERLRLVDAAVQLGQAALPSPMPTALPLDAGLCAALERAGAQRLGELATTLAITTDDALARTLGERSGCAGENLEALAVAHACAAAGVPCAVLVACTNVVGASGRAEWLAHHARAAHAAGVVLDAFLRARAGA